MKRQRSNNNQRTRLHTFYNKLVPLLQWTDSTLSMTSPQEFANNRVLDVTFDSFAQWASAELAMKPDLNQELHRFRGHLQVVP